MHNAIQGFVAVVIVSNFVVTILEKEYDTGPNPHGVDNRLQKRRKPYEQEQQLVNGGLQPAACPAAALAAAVLECLGQC